MKIESVAITDSSFGSQNLVFLYFMLWIQIRNQSHHVDNLDPHPDPHQIEKSKFIRRIRIHTIFLDVDQKCMEYEPILAR